LRIFEENQNPLDMHTAIMCINIIQNIKAVGDSRTNHVSAQGNMSGGHTSFLVIFWVLRKDFKMTENIDIE
jgi:hypothetical protein